jgi:hypothetical protein
MRTSNVARSADLVLGGTIFPGETGGWHGAGSRGQVHGEDGRTLCGFHHRDVASASQRPCGRRAGPIRAVQYGRPTPSLLSDPLRRLSSGPDRA